MTETSSIDLGVLEATPPAFTAEHVSMIALDLFGVGGNSHDLGSERDQTFMLLDGAGAGLAVLKVSNPAEDPATVTPEEQARRTALLYNQRARPAPV